MENPLAKMEVSSWENRGVFQQAMFDLPEGIYTYII